MFESKIFKFLFLSIFPLGILLIASGLLFSDDLGNPSLAFALYSATIRKAWAVLFIILIIGCTQKSKNWKLNQWEDLLINLFIKDNISDFLNMKFTILLGKLTFSAYLIHLMVQEILIGGTNQPNIVSGYEIVRIYI